MKELTLDETWKRQMKLSRWVMEERRKSGYRKNVGDLKWLYFSKKYKPDQLCWFCEFAKNRCTQCPGAIADGVKIRNRLVWCQGGLCGKKNRKTCPFDWAYKPAAFLRKLESLNKIRLAKKRK